MSAVVSIRGLSVRRRRAALRDVSLELAAGEHVAVIGSDQPSLSLLIRACAGFETFETGAVVVDGVEVGGASRSELLMLRRRIGYVSISGGLLSNMTLRENLELALRYRGVARMDAKTQIERRMASVGLEAVADERASLVPAEFHKCVAYLRALLFEPVVLLVEDPSANLHPRGREIVLALHDEARDRGIATLVADDDDAFVRPIVDRVLPLPCAPILEAS